MWRASQAKAKCQGRSLQGRIGTMLARSSIDQTPSVPTARLPMPALTPLQQASSHHMAGGCIHYGSTPAIPPWAGLLPAASRSPCAADALCPTPSPLAARR